MSKRVAFSTHLEAEQLEALRELSDRTHIPISVYVRDGINLLLLREGAEPKKSTE